MITPDFTSPVKVAKKLLLISGFGKLSKKDLSQVRPNSKGQVLKNTCRICMRAPRATSCLSCLTEILGKCYRK